MAEMSFAEHNDMVKTIPSDRTDEPLRIPVLPGRPLSFPKSYPGVAMMQSGQDWCDDNGPRSLDGSSQRRVLAQTQVWARLIVIERIHSQDPSQMPFAKDQDVIQALAPERPD